MVKKKKKLDNNRAMKTNETVKSDRLKQKAARTRHRKMISRGPELAGAQLECKINSHSKHNTRPRTECTGEPSRSLRYKPPRGEKMHSVNRRRQEKKRKQQKCRARQTEHA